MPNFRVLVPFKAMVAGVNVFRIDAGVPTLRSAVLLAAPVPPLVKVIAPAPVTVLV